MNKNNNELPKIKYSLEDAFYIINTILEDEREKYENIINSMNQKINELKIEIEQLKEENKNYKNKIFQFQNQFYSLSKTFYQMNEVPKKNLNLFKENNKNSFSNLDNNNQSKEIINQIQNEISQTLSITDNNDINCNSSINNDLTNTNKTNNSNLFNKKLMRKINSLNIKYDKNISKSFNTKINAPVKIKNNDNLFSQDNSVIINDLRANYFKNKNKTIGYNNNTGDYIGKFYLQRNSFNSQNTQKEKFNIIEKRIKNMKKDLTINKFGRNRVTDVNSDYFKLKGDSNYKKKREKKLTFDFKNNYNFD